jgi:hypothetical protein
MKLLKQLGKISLLAILIVIIIGLLTAPRQARADQQGYPNTILSLTNLPATMATGPTTISTNNYIPLRNTGLGAQLIFTGTASETAPVTMFFYPSVDGTNASLAPYGIVSLAANGTQAVIGGTNFNSIQLKGYAGIFVTVSNGTGGTINLNQTVTNSVSGVTYPGGVIFNRPNQ